MVNLPAVQAQVNLPVVYSVSTDASLANHNSYGSIYGGTRLHIRGNNFDTESPEANEVFLDGQPCEIVSFYAGGSYLQCLTPARQSADVSTVEVQVAVNGTRASCNSDVCTF